MKCADCLFFKNRRCHIDPPKIIKTEKSKSGSNTFYQYKNTWPVVFEDEFCGKFKPKGETL